MVRLALCMSGHARTYKKAFSSVHANILTKFECDVFIATYNTTQEILSDLHTFYAPKRIHTINDDDEYLQRLTDYHHSLPQVPCKHCPVYNEGDSETVSYGHKVFFCEDGKYPIDYQHKVMVHALSQFYGMYVAADLCRQYMTLHGTTYDYILRVRLDAGITNGVFDIIPLEEGQVLVNQLLNYSLSVKVHDHFFMAKPETFFQIVNVYHNLPEIIQYIIHHDYWLPLSGYQETLLFINMIRYHVWDIKESYAIFSYCKIP